MAVVIIIGNEKGGAGKTTVAIHLIASLMYLGFKVASIDIDMRQASLTRYLENRKKMTESEELDIPNPEHYKLTPSKRQTITEIRNDEQNQFTNILSPVCKDNDFVIIDTPGTKSFLSSVAHSFADVIVTPINDSFVDIDVLAEVDGKNFNIIRPGVYSQMVWEQKINRAKRDGKSIDWIIMRNRIHTLDSNNRRNIEKVIGGLRDRIGCNIAAGFSERVIFRELFLKGLTLLDMKNSKIDIPLTTSHIAARQELISLLQAINHEKLSAALAEVVL